MKRRIVVDTNLWIRALLGGPITHANAGGMASRQVHADVIVSGDGDLRADDELRQRMLEHGVKIWGVETLLGELKVAGRL
jgi:predicted nucleic acid-binding protein